MGGSGYFSASVAFADSGSSDSLDGSDISEASVADQASVAFADSGSSDSSDASEASIADQANTEDQASVADEAGAGDQASAGDQANAGDTSSTTIDCAANPCVALTFDDGPSEYTRQALDELAAEGAHATFFEIGEKAAAAPEITKAVVDGGNVLCAHSWKHDHLRALSFDEVNADYWKTRDLLSDISGETISCMRPPYGQYTAETLSAIDGPVILWSYETLDWLDQDTATVVERASAAPAGSIILMHDAYKTTVDAIPAIIENLRARGISVVSLNELTGTDIQTLPAHETYFGLPWS